jgi:hypothetical protein
MTHTTVRFQYDTARFELYLDKLTGLPAPNIRKLFKLMLSEPWNNQAAIDTVEAFLPAQIEESKEAWRQTSVDFQNGWRLVPNKQSKDFYDTFKSITVDNGCEFADYEGLERSCRRKQKRTKLYYCHPYSPHERGSNENMNRIIRRFFPKGTNFDEVQLCEVRVAEEWMNNYPRKILGWKSANQVMQEYLQTA